MTSAYLGPQHPAKSPVFTANPRAALSEAQETSLRSLIAHFASLTFTLPLPSTPVPEGLAHVAYTDKLSDDEAMWLSEETFLVRPVPPLSCGPSAAAKPVLLLLQRYLRATKWVEADARQRLIDSVSHFRARVLVRPF